MGESNSNATNFGRQRILVEFMRPETIQIDSIFSFYFCRQKVNDDFLNDRQKDSFVLNGFRPTKIALRTYGTIRFCVGIDSSSKSGSMWILDITIAIPIPVPAVRMNKLYLLTALEITSE